MSDPPASVTVGHVAQAALAAAWIVLPAVQYLAAHQRMLIITGQPAPLERIALWDLTPLYGVLVVVTILHVALRMLRNREERSRR